MEVSIRAGSRESRRPVKVRQRFLFHVFQSAPALVRAGDEASREQVRIAKVSIRAGSRESRRRSRSGKIACTQCFNPRRLS